MELNSSIGFLTAIIDGYEMEINKVKTATVKSTVLKEVVSRLGGCLEFMHDKKRVEDNYSLTLNADLTESARAYKTSLVNKETVITSLKIDLNDKIMDLHKNGYIEQENIRLEADNLKLKSQLAMASVSGREIRDLKALNEVYKSVIDEQQSKIKTHWVD